ncbi:hypothetical protein [Candidatus Frankia nodulisporulans]|nr:hypothetical protein [Candidatus Frankia nodulisporulans]
MIAALTGDAVLSRKGLTAGVWATRLRWYAGGATLLLNSWESWASVDPAAIVVHTIPPTLLFVLAEAASPYRVRFAETVRLAAEESADRWGAAGRLWGDSAPDLQESADRVATQSAGWPTPDPQESADRLAEESTTRRPRRPTGRVPTPARAGSRPHRTVEELVGEARRLPAGKQTADGIRVALRVGARRAREVRDVLAAGKQTPPGAVLNDAA